LFITESQASMQLVQPTHSSWVPFRMSIPVGQTATQRKQSTQSPVVVPAFPRGSPRFLSYPIWIVSASIRAD